MTAIKQSIFSSLLMIYFGGCIEPNTEDLWSISVEGIMQTEGFARDVVLNDNTAFVAAGQAGIQVWDLYNFSLIIKYENHMVAGSIDPREFEDLSVIDIDPFNKLLFLNESNQNVGVFSYAQIEDTLIYFNQIMSAGTKDFISFSIDSNKFIMYSADNDDGMKWHLYAQGDDGFGHIVYEPFGGDEIYTPGAPEGIDSDGKDYIALAVDQLGVELYSIDSLGADPALVGGVDTEGNAEQVTLGTIGVYAACDDAGAYFIHLETFSGTGNSTRFAKDLTVDHIAVNGNVAALSIGSKGIALYDVTDPSSPVERGIFDIGYTYKSQFWGEKLVVCSREGLQILTIEQ